MLIHKTSKLPYSITKPVIDCNKLHFNDSEQNIIISIWIDFTNKVI